jgi:hypothetical protein
MSPNLAPSLRVLALRIVRGCHGSAPAGGCEASAIVVLLALLATPSAIGCRQADDERVAAARREWSALQASKRELDAERQQLARLRARLAAAAVDPDGRLLDGGDLALAADAEARARRIHAHSQALGDRLVHHVSRLAPADDEELQPGVRAAIRLKSDEDLAVAQEWIDRGGDYRRAIEILETQLQVDPGYARLEQALARARDMRYVTRQRFARVTAGMTALEVRAALGPVNLREVRRRPAERLEAWYYPRHGGGKAAVYFRYDEARRRYVVYQTELAAGGIPKASSAVVG